MNNIHSIDDMVIDREYDRRQLQRLETYPNVVTDREVPVEVLDEEVKKKPQNVFRLFFDNYHLLVGTLANYSNHHERLRAMKQIVLVDLGEFNFFQFAETCQRPVDTFVFGCLEYQAEPDDRRTRVYEQLPWYNELIASNAVEVCAPVTEQNRSAFLKEAYRCMDDILDIKTKIIVITNSPGVLQGERVLNGRGRYVMLISPLSLEH